jgi:serine/threonine protein kinase
MGLEKDALLHGRYRIQDTLGKGGMGAVYHALDESLGVYVAVKENLIEDEEGLKQFRREATLLAGLRHPNLPRVTDHFVIEGQGQYLVMDFVAGEDLKQRLQRLGTLPEKEALLIGIAICDALSYLHNLTPPVLHRDIKPGNIRITPAGQVYLVDFGLAKMVMGSQATTTGARGLTPGYSPPEQYGTARTDERSDIYALAATMYTMLTGTSPADGLAVAINQTKLTPIRSLNPKASLEISEALEKSLAVQPEDRFQTAAELKTALRNASDTVNRRIETGELTVTPPPPDALDPKMASAGPTVPADNGMLAPSAPTVKAKSSRWIGIVVGVIVVAALATAGVIFGPELFAAAPSPTRTVSEQEALPTNTEAAGAVVEESTSTPTFTMLPSDTPEPTATFTPLPTPQGGSSQIAFASNRDGEVQIYLASLEDGVLTEPTQLTDREGGACQPTWSPDGQRLVFIAPCPGNQQTYPRSSLFIIDADGSDRNPLPSSPIGDFDPEWSPVDNRIVFTTIREFNRAQVYILDIDTGEFYNVSNSVNSDSQPTWSPDGELIAFVSNRVLNRGQVWVMDTQGENVNEFSRSSTRTNLEPDWSSAGGLLVYTQFDNRGRGIPNLFGAYWNEDAARSGMNEFRLSQDSAGMRETDFSPDGQWIVFSSNPDFGDLDIYLMRVNGSELTQLTTNEAEDFDPAWRPNIP